MSWRLIVKFIVADHFTSSPTYFNPKFLVLILDITLFLTSGGRLVEILTLMSRDK